eukprot:568842-Rhodomonas_salina.1
MASSWCSWCLLVVSHWVCGSGLGIMVPVRTRAAIHWYYVWTASLDPCKAQGDCPLAPICVEVPLHE